MKIKFIGKAKIAKIHNGERNPYIGTEYDSDSNYLNFRIWEKYGKKRIYVDDYRGRSVAYIDCDNGNKIETEYSEKSEVYETVECFVDCYEF